MTSEELRLGDKDAVDRWVGVRRHQAVLAVLGVGLAGDWVLRRAAPLELLAGLLALVGVAPAGDGQSVAERSLALARFLLRPRWFGVTVIESAGDLALWANGDVALRGYELSHRGRLDLSGADVSLAEGLASLVDAASAAGSTEHISTHVVTRELRRTTFLALPLETPAPEGWRPANDRLLAALDFAGDTVALRYFERLTYLRGASALLRVYRVRDFSSVPLTRPLLERLLREPCGSDLSWHVDVVAGAKSQRLTSRAVHRVASDAHAARAVGFRRTARSTRQVERLQQREVLVAEGRALVRLAVFLVVRATSLQELDERSRSLRRRANDAGLRLEHGWASQGPWFQWQLPGGPRW